MTFRLFLAALAAATVAACSLPAMNNEVDALAKGFFESVRSGADLNNDPRLSPELRNGNVNNALAGARAMIPPAPPTRIDNRSQNYNTNNGANRADLRQVYVYPQGNLIVDTVLVKPAGAPNWLIAGFHVRPENPASPPPGNPQAAQQPASPAQVAPTAGEPAEGGGK